MRQFKWKFVALAATAILVACGGGSDSSKTTAVVVMGDSLADSGVFAGIPTFGRIFSVQGSSSEPNTLWTERTAVLAKVPQLCNFYKFTGSTFTTNSTPGCTSFAIGGGRINLLPGNGGLASPQSIVKQLQDAAATRTSYGARDLLLVDGGGNDAADLVGAFLRVPSDSGVAFNTVLTANSVLTQTSVTASLSADPTGATVGNLYMTALASTLFTAIKVNALDKGAQRVALLNMPDITHTPRFQAVLDSIAAASGGGAPGATARAQAQGLFRVWITTFNSALATLVAGESRIALVDFFAGFNAQMASPASFGLTNVTVPACPAVGISLDDGLPVYNFETCTAAALSAQTPPVGATGGANWWQTYAFSDGFHPTPLGHKLLADVVQTKLTAVGWL